MKLVVLSILFLMVALGNAMWTGCKRQTTMEEIQQSARMFDKGGDEIYVHEIIEGVGAKDRDVAFEALHALQMLSPKIKTHFGASVVGAIAPRLKSHDSAMLHSATSTLIEYGEYAGPLLGQLQTIVAHDNSAAAGFAAEVIGRIGLEANSAQDCLVAALNSPRLIQQSAAKSLSRIGTLNQKNLRLLEEFIVNSGDVQQNSEVAIAVLMTDPANIQARKAIEAVFSAKTNSSEYVRITTLANIKRLKQYPGWLIVPLEQIDEPNK